MVGNMSASSSFTLTVLALHHSLIALPSAAARKEERDGRTTLAATRERRAEPDVAPEAGRQRRRTADCVSRGWHTTPGGSGCANDDDFPAAWLAPAVAAHMFLDTAEQCCSKFYPGKEQECDIHLSGCRPEGGGAAAPAAVDSASYPIALKDEVEEEEKDDKEKQQEKEDQQEEEQQLEQELEEEEEEQELEEEKALKCMWHPAGSSESCAYTASYPAVWTNPEWSDMYLYESLA